ncbi:MAG TPA: hypothetical protein VHC46_04805, partial [Thermodesulfobacteriota bacterium]|nr:hypothetical protein [Thermodesulfobacteriota bacterium]
MEQDKTGRDSPRIVLLISLIIFSLAFIVYLLTTEDRPTHFNNFVRLADAMLHGRLYLTQDV